MTPTSPCCNLQARHPGRLRTGLLGTTGLSPASVRFAGVASKAQRLPDDVAGDSRDSAAEQQRRDGRDGLRGCQTAATMAAVLGRGGLSGAHLHENGQAGTSLLAYAVLQSVPEVQEDRREMICCLPTGFLQAVGCK